MINRSKMQKAFYTKLVTETYRKKAVAFMIPETLLLDVCYTKYEKLNFYDVLICLLIPSGPQKWLSSRPVGIYYKP